MLICRSQKKDLRAKPSLPDLKQQSASATRLNSLDLAQASPIDRRSPPMPSPRLRQSMLTPPLTPSSSLGGTSTLPDPSTPAEGSPVIAPAGKDASATQYVSLDNAQPLSRLPSDVSQYLDRDIIPTRFVLVSLSCAFYAHIC